jgi:glutaredoxin 2
MLEGASDHSNGAPAAASGATPPPGAEDVEEHHLGAFDGPTHWYDSIEEAHAALNRSARKHGYNLVRAHTRYDKTAEKKPRRATFKCDRHGKYTRAKPKPGVKRRPNTSTKKTDCPMSVEVYRDRDTGRWYIKTSNALLRDGQLVCVHNHPGSSKIQALASLDLTETAAHTAVSAVRLPRLYVYDSCPIGVRARAVLGLKKADHVLKFVDMHGSLVGDKKPPILKTPSGETLRESGAIIEWVDEHYGDRTILQPASGRQDIADWTMASISTFLRLIYPRVSRSPIPDFATKRSRDYFRQSKEPHFGKFSELLAKTTQLLAEANASLAQLEAMLFSDRFVNANGLSYDDIEVFSTLRGLTIVKGLAWPTKVRAFVDYYSKAGDIPLFDAMAQ